jgi:sulfate/thiosulfate-binding protein
MTTKTPFEKAGDRRPRFLLPLFALLIGLIASGCGAGAASSERLSVVAFSTPREAYAQLIPEFTRTPEGKGSTFDQSYGSSGEQSRAAASGLPADFVHLALAPDLDRLVEAGVVSKDWTNGPHQGILTHSTVAIVVRPGNPKGIRTWDDLLKEDVELVTPNPFTSGGARWNLMAAYGAWTRSGDSQEEALNKLEQLLRNTPVQPKSAREALQVFAGGKGDAMLAYEQEAIQAEDSGTEIEHFVPDATIRIDNPAAITETSKNKEDAQAWLNFLYTPEAQKTFASFGYRPVITDVAEASEFPTPTDLFTIDDLGGWDSVMEDFFDRDSGYVARINKRLGVATDG